MGKISVNDKILIENLRKEKRWGSKKLLNEFLSKGWSRSGLDSLLRRIDARGSAQRKVGRGRPRSLRTSVSISKVEDLIFSQDNAPSTQKVHGKLNKSRGLQEVLYDAY